MANAPAGKSQVYVRLKKGTINALNEIAPAANYHTLNLLAADIIEESVQFLTDKKRTAMPDILQRLKSLDLSAPIAGSMKVNESGPAPAPQILTPAQTAVIEDMLNKKLGTIEKAIAALSTQAKPKKAQKKAA